MKRKRGRPPIEHPKANHIYIRIYDEDRVLLSQVCKEYNVTQYDILMRGIKAITAK